MTRTSKRPRDTNQLAKAIVDLATRDEQPDLTMRMQMRRFTRLTHAFSKKVENHAYAVALHMMYYNFVRINKTLRMTPAMASGVSDKLWEIGDIAKLVENAEEPSKKRGAYRKREK